MQKDWKKKTLYWSKSKYISRQEILKSEFQILAWTYKMNPKQEILK